jgi:hypothetical protein
MLVGLFALSLQEVLLTSPVASGGRGRGRVPRHPFFGVLYINHRTEIRTYRSSSESPTTANMQKKKFETVVRTTNQNLNETRNQNKQTKPMKQVVQSSCE